MKRVRQAPGEKPDTTRAYRDGMIPQDLTDFDACMLKMVLMGEAREALAAGQDDAAIEILRYCFDLPQYGQEMPTGFVYIVMAEGLDRYKIGFSTVDPAYRVAALQTGSPVPLKIVAVIPKCSPVDECALHEHFRLSRLAGEWFRGTPDLLEFIQKHAETL